MIGLISWGRDDYKPDFCFYCMYLENFISNLNECIIYM